MNGYNLKTVIDYVNGNYIDDYDIERLEDNYQFMIDVIKCSNDKNLYNLCSDNVKNNYEFVKFIVKRFSDDIDFICMVADNYLNNSSDESCQVELLLLMVSFIKDRDSKYYVKYKMILEAAYFKKIVLFEAYKMENQCDLELIKEFGMGFLLIEHYYGSSDMVVRYYAERFINSIFPEDNSQLEDFFHRNFKKAEDIGKNGINTYLLNVIDRYDMYLSAYVSTRIYLLDDLKKRIDKVKARWNVYNSLKERKKYDILLDRVYRYMDDHVCEFSFNDRAVLFCISDEIGILDKIKNYLYYEDDDEIDKMIDEFRKYKGRMEFIELVHYNKIKKIMIDISSQDVPDEIDDYIECVEDDEKRKGNSGGKILRLEFGGNLEV